MCNILAGSNRRRAAFCHLHEASPLSHRAPICSRSCRKAEPLPALGQQTIRGLWQEDAPPHLPAPAPEGTLRLHPTPSPAGQHPLQAAAAAPPLPQACCRTLEPSCVPAAREGPPDLPTGSRSRAVQGALMLQRAALNSQAGPPPAFCKGKVRAKQAPLVLAAATM